MLKSVNAKISDSNSQITETSYCVVERARASFKFDKGPPKNLLASRRHVMTRLE